MPRRLPDPEVAAVGARVREARLHVGATQAELAAVLGVGCRQVRRYESGRTQLTLGAARDLARALDVDPAWLAGWTWIVGRRSR